MTLTEHTIEAQIDELKGQYKFAQNIIRELLDHSHEIEQRVERQDRLINNQRQVITDLECRLGAANSPVGECKCGGECPNG